MAILLDTQVLAWIGVNDPRLGRAAFSAILDGAEQVVVSAVTAYEFADLNRRGRFGADLALDMMLARLGAEIADYPAECWRIAAALPLLHRDPVDRMLVAHAIHADLILITADETMRSYPVRTLW